jgi:hypothetical protein
MSQAHKSIPSGWRFYIADFSIVDRKGSAMLSRDEKGTKSWHKLDDAGKENTPLFLTGYGATVNEAIDDAIRFIPKEAA